MKFDTQTTVEIVKEIFKLPLDGKTNTVKYQDIIDLVHELISKIPEEGQEELLKKFNSKNKG